jgi:hypothetical protein
VVVQEEPKTVRERKPSLFGRAIVSFFPSMEEDISDAKTSLADCSTP